MKLILILVSLSWVLFLLTINPASAGMEIVKPLMVGIMAQESFDHATCKSLVIRVDKTINVESICNSKADREKLYKAIEKKHGFMLTKKQCVEDNVYKLQTYVSRCTSYIR